MNNITKKVVLIYVIISILISFSILSYADFPPMPGLPHTFYGTAKYDDGTAKYDDGTALPEGSLVKAVIDNENYTTTVINGTYGVNTPFYVEDPDNDNTGKTIVFYINNEPTDQTTIFNPGTTNLNLTLEKGSTGGSGGGSPGGGGLPTEDDLLNPVARINAPSSGFTNQSISINASGSYDPDGEILSYIWSFGDGSNGSGFEVTHIYESAGEYRISLVVTDNDNLIDAAEMNISIIDSSDEDDLTDDEEAEPGVEDNNGLTPDHDEDNIYGSVDENNSNYIPLILISVIVIIILILLWKLKFTKK